MSNSAFNPQSISSPLTTKGDLWGFSTANARLPVGANETILTPDSTQALGLKYKPGPFLETIRHITTTGAYSITLDGSADYFYRLRLCGSATPSAGDGRIGFLLNADSGSNYRNSWHKNVNGTHDIGAETLPGMNAVWMGSQDQYVFDAEFRFIAVGGVRAPISGVIAVGRQSADNIISEVSAQMWKSNSEITAISGWYVTIATIDAYLTLERIW